MLDEEYTMIMKKTANAARAAQKLIDKIMPGDTIVVDPQYGSGTFVNRRMRGFFMGSEIFSSENEILYDSTQPFIVIGKDVALEGYKCIVMACNNDDKLKVHNVRKTEIIGMIMNSVTFTVNGVKFVE